MKSGLAVCVWVLISWGASAQEEKERKEDKDGKGHKRKELRDLSPDRPHQTESPITVDKGHIMIETDLINNTTDRKTYPHSSTTGFLYFNFKAGIAKHMDVEVLSNAFSTQRFQDHFLPTSHAQFPDLTFRYKYNLIGDDGGSTAVCLMPFITTTNFFAEKWKAESDGLWVNAEHLFNEKYEIGYTGGVTTQTINPFFTHLEWFSTVSFSYSVVGPLNHFVEVSERIYNTGAVRNNYSVDSGFTFTPTRNNQFDMGFYYFVPIRRMYIFLGTTIRI